MESDVPSAEAVEHPDRQAVADLCTAWGAWQREARCIALENGHKRSVIALPNATYTQLLRLHDAVRSQPAAALDRRVFELYHLYAVRNIKAQASRLGISRQHFYRLLWAFEFRVYRAASQPRSL